MKNTKYIIALTAFIITSVANATVRILNNNNHTPGQYTNWVAVDAASVPADVIAREKSIIVELMKQDPKMAGKPDEMLAKIAEGKMGAFFKEQTLTAQAFVKDSSKTVADYLKENGDVKVTSFKRVALG